VLFCGQKVTVQGQRKHRAFRIVLPQYNFADYIDPNGIPLTTNHQVSFSAIKKDLAILKQLAYLVTGLVVFIFSINSAAGQSCTCTNNITGSTPGPINVPAGQTWCLKSGTYTGGFSLAAGATLCIDSGASLGSSPSSIWFSGDVKGTIINRGTINMTGPYSAFSANIINYGTYNSNGFQQYSGTLENYGRVKVWGYTEFASGAVVKNYGKLYLTQINVTGTTITNYDSLVINSGLTFNSGTLNNAAGVTSINMSTTGSNMNFTGTLENSGLMLFAKISSISATINNYGRMMIYNSVSDISESTYLTNDSLLQFINIDDVQFNGPMLTNNGRMTISHSTKGNFKMNKPINQLYNNGIIITSGDVELNNAGAKLVNNCRIVCRTFYIQNGITENNGLLWDTEDFKNNGSSSYFKNAATGQVRGKNFRNTGYVSGYGSFYFTGNTDNTNVMGAASFAGDNASSTILFFDASSPGGNVFDAGNYYTNTTRPSSLTPSDTNSYNCTAPPTVAGYPPTTKDFLKSVCDISSSITIKLADSVAPHTPVGGSSFTVQYSTLRLFEYGNSANPGNNTTNLTIAGKGTFVANTTTGNVVFTPVSGFSGSAIAEYRVSNTRSGDPIVYPSGRKKITITVGGGLTSPTVSVTGH